MADQLPFGKSHGAERADDGRLLADRVADRNTEYKRDDRDHDIEKKLHHSAVTAHVFARKADCLVGIAGNIVFQPDFLGEVLHQLLAAVVLLFFVRRRIHILERVVEIQCFVRILREFLRGAHCHAEFERVKHGVIVVREHRAVVREGHKSGDRPSILCADGFFAVRGSYPVPDFETIVVRVHPVDRDLARSLWKLSFHQTDQVHPVPVPEYADRAAVFQAELPVKKLIQIKAQSFRGF